MAKREDFSENAGECDRCERWTRHLMDGFCCGCWHAERQTQPVTVPEDYRTTPGFQTTKRQYGRFMTDDLTIVGMLDIRERHHRRDAELETSR